MNKKKLTNKQVEEALRKAGGIMAGAAQLLGVYRSTITRRVQKSKKLQKLVEELIETTLDLCETKLIQAIKEGEPWAIAFYLKCKGKKRGYIEKPYLDIHGDIELTVKAPPDILKPKV